MSQAVRRSEAVLSVENPSARGIVGAPWWVYGVVLLGIVLLTAGAGIALLHPAFLVSPHDEINGAVRVYPGYLVSRNLGIAVMLLVALGLRGRSVLSNMVMLTGLIQILDGAIDVWEDRWPIALGVLILGLLFLAAAWRLSGFWLWQRGAWTGSR